MKTAKCPSHGLPVYFESASQKKMIASKFGKWVIMKSNFIAVLKMLKAKYDLEAAFLVILI
jgi:hypothetical protein